MNIERQRLAREPQELVQLPAIKVFEYSKPGREGYVLPHEPERPQPHRERCVGKGSKEVAKKRLGIQLTDLLAELEL